MIATIAFGLVLTVLLWRVFVFLLSLVVVVGVLRSIMFVAVGGGVALMVLGVPVV